MFCTKKEAKNKMETIIVTMPREAAETRPQGKADRQTGMTPAEALEKAGKILRSGGLVAFPTETVYGLGGNALDREAARKIYEAKGRPSDNPLIVHIADREELDKLVLEIPPTAQKLMEAFWPGPMTIILKKNPVVPDETTGGLDTVAIRMPSDPIAAALIRAARVPIAAPSANLSGRPSPTRAGHVIEDMKGRIEMILDGGPVGIGLESTIIDCTEEAPVILRPGYISREMVEKLFDDVSVDAASTGPMREGERPKAPGMKYRHYAPKAALTLFEGETGAVTAHIRMRTAEALRDGRQIGIIATDETFSDYPEGIVRSIGSRQKEETVAHNLFAVLREFDDLGVEAIYSESFSTEGLGQAIMNRLTKAAGYQIVHV